MSQKKNKFIYFIIFLIISIIGLGIYLGFIKKQIDKSTYVVLLEGSGFVNEIELKKNIKAKLQINDVIKTTGKLALAIVEWGDGSVTRVGGNSELKIEELYVSDNNEKMQISFKLLSGKTWSNVISFIGEDSYFKENFGDTEAAVRGTIFNVDLENEYLYVIDHKVSLTNKIDGLSYLIEEKQAFNISNFSFIKLQEFITNIKDKTFDVLNRGYDNKFLNELEVNFANKIKEFNKLLEIDTQNLDFDSKQEIYNKLLSSYQEINFVDPSNDVLYNLKIDLKRKLTTIAPDSAKQGLVNSSLSDFKDSVSSKNYSNIGTIFETIGMNSELVHKGEFLKYFKKINFKEELKNTVIDNIYNFKNILGKGFDYDNINMQEFGENMIYKAGNADAFIKETLDKSLEGVNNTDIKVQNGLDTIYDKSKNVDSYIKNGLDNLLEKVNTVDSTIKTNLDTLIDNK